MENPTHNHKRAGAVVVLRSTAGLVEVQASNGDKFWAKRCDVTELAAVSDRTLPRKKRSK
ncbi:MAG TPA: hypothetical protein VMB47_17785 [Candidatus Aquilonibacter sp.]|nr:hypothetical protein [Candidatus Aquilonibacter sp.]